MKSQPLNRVAQAVRSSFDRRTIGGIVIGAAVVMSTMATAQTGGGWFSSLFSSSGATGGGNNALISQQDSVVTAAINEEAEKCADGAPGTIGAAINTAVNVHVQLASATPNVEALFNANDSCFAGLSNLFDLSFAIPSLASIMSSATNAVMKYAEKKVCTAVNKVTGMVTSPINQAIGNVNNMAGFGDINGMVNRSIGNKMSTIDPELGREYHPGVAESSYTINTQPFSSGQTTFDSGAGGTSAAAGAGYSQPAPVATAAPQQSAPQQESQNRNWFEALSGILN